MRRRISWRRRIRRWKGRTKHWRMTSTVGRRRRRKVSTTCPLAELDRVSLTFVPSDKSFASLCKSTPHIAWPHCITDHTSTPLQVSGTWNIANQELYEIPGGANGNITFQMLDDNTFKESANVQHHHYAPEVATVEDGSLIGETPNQRTQLLKLTA